MIIDNELMKSKESSLDPFDNHVSNCGKHWFENLRTYMILANYDS